MKNILEKSCVILLAIILLTGMLTIPVKAKETAKVSISSGTATVGNEVSVTVKVSSSSEIVMCDLLITYDSNILEAVSGFNSGGSGNVRLLSTDTTSFTLKFKTLNPGSSNIGVSSSSIIASMTEDSLEYAGNVVAGTITASAPASYSANNNLASLSISPGTLSPAFSTNVTSYTASVGADCAKLIVSAVAEDSAKAKVSVTGQAMDPGKNTTKITVTAENGSTKVYTITTMKDAMPETPTMAVPTVSTTINGVIYNIVSDFTNHALPVGYTATQFDFNGQSVTIGKGDNGLTIMYLEKADESGEGAFYVYDTASKSFSILNSVVQPVLSYIILPITSSMEIPNGFTKSTYEIAGNIVDVLVPNDSNVKYCLFYGVDSTGKAGWYCYDYAEQTVQKYYGNGLVNAVAPVLKQNDNTNMWKIIAASSAVVSFILLAAIIVLAVKAKAKKTDSYYEDNDNNDTEDIFSLIAHRELASKESSDNNEQINNDLSSDELDIHRLENDELPDQEDYNSEIASEIASEIGMDAAATQEINFEDDDFEFDAQELLEDDEFESDTDALSEDNDQDDDDQDNDISDMKDILEDDDEDDENNSDDDDDDDDDFEFLDIEDLDFK